jgi:branched-chain amino acid transport system permease protein
LPALDEILQFTITGISIGSLYAIVGIGFMIIYSVTRVVNFAQGEFVMLGGMLSVTFYQWGLPLSISILLAIAATTLLGMVFYQSVIYPIRKAPGFSLVLITFASSLVIRGVATICWGSQPRSLPYFLGSTPVSIAGAILNPQAIWVITSTGLMAASLFFFFRYTITGKAFEACAVSTFLATLMGIKPTRMGLFAFTLASALTALAGAVITPLTFPHVGIGIHLSVKGFTAALIGGLDRIEGVIVGGLALGVLEALGAGFVSSRYKDVIALVVLLILLTFRHQGLLGKAKTGRV